MRLISIGAVFLKPRLYFAVSQSVPHARSACVVVRGVGMSNEYFQRVRVRVSSEVSNLSHGVLYCAPKRNAWH